MSKAGFWRRDWFLGLAVAVGLFLFAGSDLLQSLERKAYDMGVRATDRAPSDRIAVIAIDDASLRNIGRWPWSRDVHARLTESLTGGKAKVVGSLVFFTEPQLDPGLAYINKISGEYRKLAPDPAAVEQGSPLAQMGALLQEAEGALNTDRKLADSYARAGNVLLPMLFALGEPRGKADRPLPDFVTRNALKNVQGNTPDMPFSTAADVIVPVDLLGRATAGIGHLNARVDVDGGIRSEPLVLAHFDELYPALSMLIAAQSLNLGPGDIKVALGEGVNLANLRITTDPRLQMYTYFYKDRDGRPAFPVDSFFDVYSGKIPADKYKDKIVLIGPTAPGLGTASVTPVSPAMAPVLALAHSVSSILQEHFFVVPTWGVWAEYGAYLLVALYLIAVLPRLKAGMAAAVTALLLVAIVATHFGLMTGKGLWLQLMLPAVLLVLGHVALTTKRFLVTEEGKEKSEAESAASNRMLGLAFQGQGQLDMAFDYFRKCPVDDTLLDNLYNLALDFERKRQFNKAESVFRYMAERNPKYRDVGQKAVARQAAVGDRHPRRRRGAHQRQHPHRRIGREADARALPGRAGARQGRDGRGVPGQGSEDRAHRGDQDDGARAGVRGRRARRREGALLPRSRDRGAPEPPEHRHDLRCRRGARPRLHRDGVPQGPGPGAVHQARQPAAAGEGGVDRRARRRGARVRAQAERGPPRHQAREHHVRAGVRHGEGHRLRHRAHHRFVQDQDRHGARHAVLHVAGAAGRARRSTAARTSSRSRRACTSSLCGRLPFEGESMAQLMFKIANEPAPDILQFNAKVPPAVVDFLARAMAKDADERFQTGEEFAQALRACVSGRGAQQRDVDISL